MPHNIVLPNPSVLLIPCFDLCQCRRKLVEGKINQFPAARSWSSDLGLRQAVPLAEIRHHTNNEIMNGVLTNA
jgi:hypothetical protein